MKTIVRFTAMLAMLATTIMIGAPQANADTDTSAKATEMWKKRVRDTVTTHRVFSKIRLKMAIASLGKLPQMEAWLASFEVAPSYTALEAWNDANVISDDFPCFYEFYEKAIEVLEIQREEGDDILAKCQVPDSSVMGE